MRRVCPALFIGLSVFVFAACNKPAPVENAVPAVAAGPAEYDIARLAGDLRSTTAGRREKAIEMAPVLDAQGIDVLPTLLDALKDPTASEGGTYGDRPTSTREAAVVALLALKDKGTKALTDTGLKTLEQGLKDPKPTVREHTASAVGRLGPAARPTAPALTELCSDRDRDVRSAGYRALERIKSVPAAPILRLLLHADLVIASEAAAALAWLKPTGSESVAPLLEAVRREAREGDDANDLLFIRNAAAEALAGVGKAAEPAIPTLVDLVVKATVSDVERLIRPMRAGDRASDISGPVLALRRMGKPAVAPVIPLLKHEQPIVRYQAAAVLSGMGPEGADALPAVETALETERGLAGGQLYVFEELAAAALNLGGNAGKVAAAVIEILSNEDEGVRLRAAQMLARIGRQAAPAVPRLAELLNDPSPEVRLAAAEALAATGAAASAAVPVLAKAVEGEDAALARSATATLRVLGPAAAPAVPALVRALSSSDQNLCIEAAQALAAIGPDAAPAVPTIAKQLGDPRVPREERLALLQATSAIGRSAREATPEVTRLMSDKDASIRMAAADTLGRVGGTDTEAIKQLAARLTDSHQSVRVAALRALANMGASAAAPEVKAFRDRTNDPVMKVWAASTLVAFGHDEEASRNVLLAALKDTTSAGRSARSAAIEAAGGLGPKAKAVVPDLMVALKDKTPVGRKDGEQVREVAARALGRLGAKEAVPRLIELLRDPDRRARRAAVDALGALGPDAIVAAARLRDLARNDPAVAEVALRALERIEPPTKIDPVP